MDSMTYPRLTAQDIRDDPYRYLGSDADPVLYELADSTRCEHDYYLTASCPGCDWVDERLEDMTPTQRKVYYLLVAYGSSQDAPGPIRRASVERLAEKGLVIARTAPDGSWTAVPSRS